MSRAPVPAHTSAPDRAAEPVALIGRPGASSLAGWLEALSAAMPSERIELAETIEARGEQDRVRLALVANPDPAVVRRFRGLQWMHSLWAGVETLLAEPAFDALPIVRLVDPELARTMAEAVLAWTLYLHREMPAYRAAQAEAAWRPRPYRPPSARRIGVLGLGEMGGRAAASLLAAGFPVSGWSRSPRRIDGVDTRSGPAGLDAVVSASDILILLLPATDATRGLVDRTLLARMPAGASLINFGRGPLVVVDDLIAALDAGRLDHAVLDVFDVEPLPAASPLWRHPRVTVLPHVSAATTPATAAAIVARHVKRWRATGELPAAVDRHRGY